MGPTPEGIEGPTPETSIEVPPSENSSDCVPGSGFAGCSLRPGQLVYAKCDVYWVPSGWDAANFLIPIVANMTIRVLHVEGDFFWGDTGDQTGWAPVSAVKPAQVDGDLKVLNVGNKTTKVITGDALYGEVLKTQGTWKPLADETKVVEEKAVEEEAHASLIVREAPVCRDVFSTPSGWSSKNFLLAASGEVMQIQYCDGEWLWGRIGEREGWLPCWAFEEAAD